MKSEPLLVYGAIALALSVACAIGLNVTHTPVSLVVSILTAAVPIIGLVAAGRTQVLSQTTAENVVTKAIQQIPPATEDSARAQAKEMVKNA